MRIQLSDTLAPHYCRSCGEIGAVLCPYCKYDIITEPYEICVVCNSPNTSTESLCKSCQKPYQRLWCVGARSDVLRDLITDYKFNRNKATYQVLADLLNQRLPQLPEDTIVVPVPTVRSHVRQRGYDHCALIAEEFAKHRGLQYFTALQRINNEAQRGANRIERKTQASRAFTTKGALHSSTYLVIDDVLTTGATVEFAAKALKDVGATNVWVAVIAHQPLEKANKI